MTEPGMIEAKSIGVMPTREYVKHPSNNEMQIREGSERTHTISYSPQAFLATSLETILGKGEIFQAKTPTDTNELDENAVKVFTPHNETQYYYVPYSKIATIANSSPGVSGELVRFLEKNTQLNTDRKPFTEDPEIIHAMDKLLSQLSSIIPSTYTEELLEPVIKRHETTHSDQEIRFGLEGKIKDVEQRLKTIQSHNTDVQVDITIANKIDELRALSEIQAMLSEMGRHGKNPLAIINEHNTAALKLLAADCLGLFFKYRGGITGVGDFQASRLESAFKLMQSGSEGTFSYYPHYPAYLLLFLGEKGLGENTLFSKPTEYNTVDDMGRDLLMKMESALADPSKFIQTNFTESFAKKIDMKLMSTHQTLQKNAAELEKQ